MGSSTDLLAILREHKDISEINHRMLVRFMDAWGVTAAHALLETHLFPDSTLCSLMSKRLHLPKFDVRRFRPHRECLDKLPYVIARKTISLPVELSRGKLVCAVFDPLDQMCTNLLKETVGIELELQIGARSDIQRCIGEAYPAADQVKSVMGS